MKDYSDIIDIQNWNPLNHSRMTIENRASQFSPFSALTGYEEELKEARRVVDEKIVLSEDQKDILDQTLQKLSDEEVLIIYFVKDLKKEGGYYKKIKSRIKRIDPIKKEIVLVNKEKINIEKIIEISIIE